MSNEKSRLNNYFKLTKKKNPLKITNSPDFFHDSESGHSFFIKYLKNKNILPKINSIQNSTNSTLNFNNLNNTTKTNFTNFSKKFLNSRNNESSIYFNNNSKNFEKNFQSLDEKIEKTKEKAKEIFDKKLNTQKEKLKNKENKFEIKINNKKNILLKLKEKNKNIKEMKDLRLKIQLLIKNKIISNCLTFENHIEFFNKKILDYFDSENFIENNLHFHSYFRNDKSEFESHPRLNFIMDLDEIKKNSLNSEKIDFYKDFTQKERELIENDPTYFLLNKEKFFKNLDFLNISLTKKLNREEKKENNKNKYKNFNSFDNNNNNNENFLNENEENDKKKFKNKISVKEKDDIYKNSLIHAQNIINKILYENKKKFLILEKNKEKVNKTMSEMTRKIQELNKPNFNKEINYDFEQIKYKGNFNEKNFKMNKRLRKTKLLTKKMELIKLDKLNFAKIDDNENDFDNNMNEEQKASFNLKQYLEAENREINEYVLKIKQIYSEKK